MSREQGAAVRAQPATRARDWRVTGAGLCEARGWTLAPLGLHPGLGPCLGSGRPGPRPPRAPCLGGPAGTHLHVPRGGAVVGPSEDLGHVPQDVDGGQQVAAVAGAVLGDLHQRLDDFRHPFPRQPALRLRQVLPGLGRQGFGCRDPAGHVRAGAKDLPQPESRPRPQPGAEADSRVTPGTQGSDRGHGATGRPQGQEGRGGRRGRRPPSSGCSGSQWRRSGCRWGAPSRRCRPRPARSVSGRGLGGGQRVSAGSASRLGARLCAGIPPTTPRPEPSGRDPQPQNQTRPRLSGGFKLSLGPLVEPLPIQSLQPQPPTQGHPWGGHWSAFGAVRPQVVDSLKHGHACDLVTGNGQGTRCCW